MSRITVFAAVLGLTGGCAHNLRVTSDPTGAHVLIDGKDTGQKTPAAFKPRAVPSGAHKLTVQLEGFQTPTERSVRNEKSVGLVVWSLIFWPAGFYNLAHGFSKTDPEALHFNLHDPGAPVSSAPAAAQTTAASLERRRITATGTKCAAMPLRMSGMAEGATFVADELVLAELQQSGFQAIGPDDINAMLGFDKTKQVLGCDEASCAAEIGAALGVDYLAAGSVSSIEGSTVLTLKLIDVKNTRVLARASRVVAGGQGALPQMIADAVGDLVARSGL